MTAGMVALCAWLQQSDGGSFRMSNASLSPQRAGSVEGGLSPLGRAVRVGLEASF